MQLDEFLDLLEGVRPAGNGYVAICPAHDDREASLGVTEADDRLLVRCHAGCDTADVLMALDKSFTDLFTHSVNYAEPEAIYPYFDALGQEVYQVLRYPGKKFKQRHKGPEGEWVWNMEDVERVPYHLPEVREAVATGRTIGITEGEKDADRLRGEGITATCNPGGAGKWRPEFAQWFQGARVIIIADRDEVGRKHANTVKETLIGVAAEVLIVQAKKGKDASDHLDFGFSITEFEPLRERTRRGIITAAEMADEALSYLDQTEQELPGHALVDGVPIELRQGRMYALGAYTGEGKTTVALQWAHDRAAEGRRGGYFSLEMSGRDLRNTLLAHAGIPFYLLEKPWLLRQSGYLDTYMEAVEQMRHWNLEIDVDSRVTADKVEEIARDREYEFVVIDHIHRFAWRDRRNLEDQIQKLTNLALEQNIVLLVLCQLRKFMRGKDMQVYPRPTRDDFRETSQIADDSSMALAVWRQRAQDGLTYTGLTELIVLKNRHITGPENEPGRIYFPQFDVERKMFMPTRGLHATQVA